MAFSFLIVEKGKGKEKYTFKICSGIITASKLPYSGVLSQRYIGWKKPNSAGFSFQLKKMIIRRLI